MAELQIALRNQIAVLYGSSSPTELLWSPVLMLLCSQLCCQSSETLSSSKGFTTSFMRKGAKPFKMFPKAPWVFHSLKKNAGLIPFCILETLSRDV